jgi:hypothetical protein
VPVLSSSCISGQFDSVQLAGPGASCSRPGQQSVANNQLSVSFLLLPLPPQIGAQLKSLLLKVFLQDSGAPGCSSAPSGPNVALIVGVIVGMSHFSCCCVSLLCSLYISTPIPHSQGAYRRNYITGGDHTRGDGIPDCCILNFLRIL